MEFWTRRRLLASGAAGAVALATGGFFWFRSSQHPSGPSQSTSTAAVSLPTDLPFILTADLQTGRPVVVTGVPDDKSALLKFFGITLWIMPMPFSDAEHAALNPLLWPRLPQIVAQIKSWGANCVRLRVDALQYNRLDSQGKQDYLRKLREVCQQCTQAGLYVNVTLWDIVSMGVDWLTRYQELFDFIDASLEAIGDNPRVFYSPISEPNGVPGQVLPSDAWVQPTENIVKRYRTKGYRGLLFLGTWNYSYGYRRTTMTKVVAYDWQLLDGVAQIGFEQHDYATITVTYGPSHTFSFEKWLDRIQGPDEQFLIGEWEVGNQNKGPDTVHPDWTKAAVAAFGRNGQAVQQLPTYAGGAMFGVYYWPYQLPEGNSMLDAQGNLTNFGRLILRSYLGNPSA